ncbi:rRNA pseudouridine synthase, partial [Candidatus Babeliales bacterium]|nr:rRNA pseudouridine synthase [Candidatus Babeliales bacterium]
MYLLKYLAHCGICSRRKAVDLIKSGVVRVNGDVVTMPYITIDPASDEIIYQGQALKPREHIYLLLNKPEGYITTCSDTSGRKTVLELVKGATEERIYPVGRLDRETTGLLLFTNDGTLAQKLSHPSNEVVKVYKAFLDKRLRRADCKKLLDGVTLEDGFMKVDSCSYDDPGNARSVVVKIHS